MKPAELIRIAMEAAEHAYAPYSNFAVGSVLLCNDGTLFTGCNVENTSLGLTNCAERTAVFTAIAAGKLNFKAMAVATAETSPPYPCGACRQVLTEFCDADFPIYISSADGYEVIRLHHLLPHAFSMRGSHDGS